MSITKIVQHVAVGALLASVTASSACVEKDTSTQITVSLSAETQVPQELDTIEVVVVDAKGAEIYRNDYPVSSARFFPTTLAIVPRSDDSLDGPVTIEVRGSKASGSASEVFRRAVVPFFKGRTLLVPMPLRMACFDLTDCKAGETCAGGRCVSATVDASQLTDYDEALVFGGLPSAHCFDEAQCLAGSKALAVAADCTFPLPPAMTDANGNPYANVSIRWAAASGRVIELDGDDPVEGWSRVSASKGQLSPGICDSLHDPQTNPALRRVPDRALDARLSVACPTKNRLQPPCPGSDGQAGIGTAIQNP